MTIELNEFKKALHGERGELDAWLEVNDEAECREIFKAIEAERRGVPDYVWMIGTKGFMALFATEEAANDWQQMNGTNTPASYIQPVSIPVIAAAPKPDRKHETVPTMAEPALARYNAAMEGCTEHNPVERLRFFLSIALTGQDWLDVERFIDDLKATSQPAKKEAK